MKLHEEVQQGNVTLDAQRRQIQEEMEKNKEMQINLDSAKASIEDYKLSDESIISYNKEAQLNKRILEKNAVLQKKLDRLRSTSVLEEELRECRVCVFHRFNSFLLLTNHLKFSL